jgi:transcriptional regulator with XRE-family HTH domain
MKMEAAETIDTRLARRLREARGTRGLSLDQLAEASGVSRAMISRIERGESSPTAALLGRLCAGLGITMSSLFLALEPRPSPLARVQDQPTWTDPETGYVRRTVAPAGSAQEIVHVRLPAGARVAYPAASYGSSVHHILLLQGALEFGNGAQVFRLAPGDCLRVPEIAPSWYRNPGAEETEYLVLLVREEERRGG